MSSFSGESLLLGRSGNAASSSGASGFRVGRVESIGVEIQAHCFESEDVHEGIAAVREKRAPKFQGR
jgi:enoyl-CoA hydratase/carnithine racemase